MNPSNPSNPYPDESTLDHSDALSDAEYKQAFTDQAEATCVICQGPSDNGGDPCSQCVWVEEPLVKTGQGDYEHLHYIETGTNDKAEKVADTIFGRLIVLGCICVAFVLLLALVEYLQEGGAGNG